MSFRVRAAGGVLLLVLGATTATGAPGAVAAVDEVGMTVADLDRSVEFYTRVLSFEPIGAVVELTGESYDHLQGVFGVRSRKARLRLGAEQIELTEYLVPRGRAVPTDMKSNDRFFQHIAIIVRDMDEAYRHLRAHRVEHASTGPQRLPDWNPGAGGIEAFYFRDPDGHHLEVLRFPAGKGDPRWQARDRLFLGIDHTAIVVLDTERSLAFYRDALGLRVAGASENYGPEQERLNHVFGARLRITALRAATGPGIEFLEYLAPKDGRPYPADAAATDLFHWETSLTVIDATAAAEAARGAGGTWVSPGEVEIEGPGLDFPSAALVRDPDGHAIRLVERR